MASSQTRRTKRVTTTLHPGALFRAIVLRIEEGQIIVEPERGPSQPIRCDFLDTGGRPQLSAGDPVLVLASSDVGGCACVLGKIARYTAPPPTVLDHLLLEAAETLSLKCGESSVDLRKDGKLMIRGNDVLTRARRTQRIKGGTVAIN